MRAISRRYERTASSEFRLDFAVVPQAQFSFRLLIIVRPPFVVLPSSLVRNASGAPPSTHPAVFRHAARKKPYNEPPDCGGEPIATGEHVANRGARCPSAAKCPVLLPLPVRSAVCPASWAV